METEFTPIISLAGGVLIGVASVLLMAMKGRIMGATGILNAAVFESPSREGLWRYALLAGMVSGPLLVFAISGNWPEIQVANGFGLQIIGGFLVGVGVTFGSGCTSGHGVCGMARLSPRSIVATLTFMVATAITVFVIRHVLGG